MDKTADRAELRLREEGWRHDPADGFIAHVGGLWRRGASFGLLATPHLVNRNGYVHGGMLMTFVDRAFGETSRVAAGAARGATVSLTHQFMAPMRIGSFAELDPKVVRLTGRMAFLEGTVICEGVPVVSAQGVWRLTHSTDTPPPTGRATRG
ncbi:PaaI family thioesterase [Plastorhodobacter daqingensis]|uniref:PaaI family thioesterase n=1 Tax=Plastorhodobacter daqingensis TaxID=1387281 RepID=A0ABW2UQG2_9RHOB